MNKEKNYTYEIINHQKIKKIKPITFLHMIIKDYLDLSYWNWKYIKENEEIYNNDKEKLLNDIDLSDIENAIDEKAITQAHH